MPVNWGILSTARINRLFLEGARHAKGVEVVAVASRDQMRGDAFAREHGIPAADSYGLEAANLSAAIRGEAAPLLGREDAIGQARAIEALYRAAESGTSVQVR